MTLVDGAFAAAERRGAQLNIAVGSLEVAARIEENLAGRKPHALDARAERFLTFAEEARKLSNVPGAAINLMVATGGYVAAMTATRSNDLRKAYVEAMTTEVLRPLG